MIKDVGLLKRAMEGGWVDKLKADQQEAGAELAVLATVALTKEIVNFGPYEGDRNMKYQI